MSEVAAPVAWLSSLPALNVGQVKRDEPLAPWCSVRAGGNAQAWVKPQTPEQLIRLLKHMESGQVPLSILGGGANTLVGDGGVPGVTLKLPSDLFPEEVSGGDSEVLVTLCAGAAIARLLTVMKSNGLVGAEFLAGIPGTLGGAARMNAGTKNGECMTVVDALELATPTGFGWLPQSGIAFRYRHTEIPTGSVVTRVRFRLRKGDLAESQAKIDADLGYRKRTQPLSQPNFGSVFTNPPGGFAGALIESVALKGHRIGGAQISTQHANWIVNLGGAKAADITALMDLAQARVFEAKGVKLHPEVQRVGVFLPNTVE